jgi:hypothetical protein
MTNLRKRSTKEPKWAWEFGMKDPKQVSTKETNQVGE